MALVSSMLVIIATVVVILVVRCAYHRPCWSTDRLVCDFDGYFRLKCRNLLCNFDHVEVFWNKVCVPDILAGLETDFGRFKGTLFASQCDSIKPILTVRSAPCGPCTPPIAERLRTANADYRKDLGHSHWWLYNLLTYDDELFLVILRPTGRAIFHREGLLMCIATCLRSLSPAVALSDRLNQI